MFRAHTFRFPLFGYNKWWLCFSNPTFTSFCRDTSVLDSFGGGVGSRFGHLLIFGLWYDAKEFDLKYVCDGLGPLQLLCQYRIVIVVHHAYESVRTRICTSIPLQSDI